MASKAQISANRQNAQKSTGPKTAEGKEAVSQNAFKHGLFVNKAVVRDESQQEYDRHREALLAEWGPVGRMETIVAERLVNLTWRLERAQRMQNQSIDYLGTDELASFRAERFEDIYRKANDIASDDLGVPEDHMLLGRIAVRDWINYRVLDRMLMYERRIESSMYRAMNELKKLQKMRRAEPAVTAGESATGNPPTRKRRSDLKKQSQFAAATIGTKPCTIEDYDDLPPAGSLPNKAISKPIRGEVSSNNHDMKTCHEAPPAGSPVTSGLAGA